MISPVLSLVISCLAVLTTALPSQPTTTQVSNSQQSPLPHTSSLPIGPMKWTGVVFPNGTEVTLYGNIQQVKAQLLSINPTFDTDFNGTDYSTGDNHMKRHTADFCDCHSNVDPTQVSAIESGINHLASARGICHVGAGQCTNIYCSKGASIRLCNSSPSAIEPQCNYLASYAVRILNRCTFEQGGKKLVAGSLWDTDGYLIDVISNQEGGKC